MGLAEPNITAQAVQPAVSPVRGAGHVQHVSCAPPIIPASRKRKGESERTCKVAFIGSAGTGKTHKVLSLVEYLGKELHMDAEAIWIEMIDLDGGLDELTDQCIIPNEYLERIFTSLCSNFAEVSDATNDAYQRLKAHKAKYGVDGCWLVVDNMEKAWNYVQNDYCETVYGMSLVEKQKQARESQVRNKKLGQKGDVVFDKNLDWGVIKPMHAAWTKSMETCGFNILLLSPWKMHEEKDKAGTIIDTHEKFGSDDNSKIVSYIIKLDIDGAGKRRAHFLKSRATDKLPKNITDTTWTGIWAKLAEVEAYELKEKQAKLLAGGYGSAGKEARVSEIMNTAVETSIKNAEKKINADVAVISDDEIPDW